MTLKNKPGMIFLILSAEELNFTPEKKMISGQDLTILLFKKKKNPV